MLYAMNRDKKLKVGDALLRYKESVGHSYDIYLFNLLLFIRIAGYSKKVASIKGSKLLPTEEDKRFTAKLGENDLIRSLSENLKLHAAFRNKDLLKLIDEDDVRHLYTDFSKTEEYKDYIQDSSNGLRTHKSILLSLFKFCVGAEHFEELVDDHFPNWVDDKSLVVGAMKKTIKALPADERFYEEYYPLPETTRDFGEVLLRGVVEKDTEIIDLVKPTLKNWDIDRVAVIDMILLKMAIFELTGFPSIPTKVTLNEFVEISKLYSTEKSKDFINGILDRLMKQLSKDGKIVKKGRGLKE